MDLLAGQQRNGQQATVYRPPSITFKVELDQPTVNVNFTALAEAKYGWDAVHPVAARLKAFNRYDSEEESDSEPADGEAAAAEGNEQPQPARKKKRKRRDLEYYDVHDPFIDDDELALQELTVAAKDGFFVFSGPLVSEGERVRVEKVDGTTRRTPKAQKAARGRGRPRANTSAPTRPKAVSRSTTETTTVPKASTTAPSTSKVAENQTSPRTNKTLDASIAASPKAPVDAQEVPVPIVSPVRPGPIIEASPSLSSVSDHATPLQEVADKHQVSESPVKKKVLSEEVLARRLAKAQERRAVKLAEREKLKAEKLAAREAEKRALKEAKKAARALAKAEKQQSGSARQSVAPDTPVRATSDSAPAPSHTPVLMTLLDQQTAPASVSISTKQDTALQSPQVNGDPSIKKPRKGREKTVEEKAELARRAREARERKKQEKMAADAVERAALLQRALANPLIDTSGIKPVDTNLPNPVTSVMQTVKQELLQPLAIAPDVAMPDKPLGTVATAGTQGSIKPFPSFQELARTESPSGRSMSLNALLE